MDLICGMSRDIVGSLELLQQVSNIGMSLQLRDEDDESRPAPSKIDLAFRTKDIKRCFPPSARILFDSQGGSDLADLKVDENMIIVEEFAPSLRVFSENADTKIAAFKQILEHNVYFDVNEGPLQGITRKSLHLKDQSPAGDTKIVVILVVFEGLSNVDVGQYELLKPEADMIGSYTSNMMPAGIRFTIVHIPIRSVYEFAMELHGEVQRKLALELSGSKSEEKATTNKL